MRAKEKNLRALAKVLAVHGYRNSDIENIHAGAWPRYPDGTLAKPENVVVSAKGASKVSWLKVSRISNAEMKNLNKQTHNQIFTLLTMINSKKPLHWWFFTMGEDWDEAELLHEWIETNNRI